ncbi:MAG TPA: citrate/2-methylcitrate synthase, partial [Acidimicrobiales bacterium]|nr:citrate/2-methylcitrate synthase [Acidimicrobiales bacterium]
VSRGLLESRRVPGSRESRFDPHEVSRLAERRRAGGRAGALELVVDSDLTLLEPAGGLWFRGWNVESACGRVSFEEIAEWLWDSREGFPFEADPSALAVARAAVAALPSDTRPVERFRVALAAASVTDPLRFDRRPRAVAATGRRILATLVDSVAPDGDHSGHRGSRSTETNSVAERLFSLLAPDPAQHTAARHRAFEAAMVVLADHEMASSTLAARVTASTWADPYLVVLAGLSALGGPLHGGASDRLVPLLRDAQAVGAAQAIGERLRVGEQVGGFGHPVYTGRDPRADALWPLLAKGWDGDPAFRAAGDVIDVVRSQDDTFPNIDLALATLVTCADMVPGAGEAVFAVARCAGFVAHAMEEYRHRLRFRVRAAYTGPAPGTI